MSYRTPTTASKAISEKGSATRALSLKNELEERQALEKANFELKMKVIQLEEALSKSSKMDAFKASSESSETTALKQQLESKNNELEQKNLLIAKAKKALEALEALKSEALRLRSEEAEHKQIRRELEERLIALSTNESSMTVEFKKRFHELEVQFSSLKAQNVEYSLTVKALEVDKSELEERCSKYAMKIKELEESHSFLEFEKKASDRELAEARSNAAKLKDELNLTKEHVAMYENQLRDFTEELDRLKAVEKDRNKTIEELFSSQRHSENLKETHDSHVSKLHESHSTKLQELQEKHREELERAKAAAEHHSIREHHEVKTELHGKLYEKQSALEVATHKYEHAMTQLELMTSESKQKDILIQELQAQIFKREEELRQAVVLQERISRDYSEAASVLQRVQSEKSQLESRYEEVSDAFETARDNLREMKNYVNSLDSDSKMYVKELEHHRVRVSAVEDLTRENERFKLLLANMTKDLSEAQAKLDSCTRDNVHLLEELKRSKSKEELLSSKLIDSESLQNALTASKESCDEALEYERKRAANAEAAAEGLRNSISSLKLDFEKSQLSLSLEQQKSRDSQSRYSDITQSLSSVCTSLLEACHTWDSTLTIVLEGNSGTHYGDLDLSRNSGGANHGIEDILSMSSFDLIRKVSVQTERISLKVERLTKLRKNFDGFVSKAVSSVSEKLQNAQDKMALMSHRIADLQSKNDSIRNLLERETRNRTAESLEMKAFREEVIADHTRRVREADERYSTLSHSYDQEKKRSAHLYDQIQKISDENINLKRELETLKISESRIDDLGSRMQDIAETNQLLILELENKSQKYQEVSEMVKNLLQEKDRQEDKMRGAQESLLVERQVVKEQRERIQKLENDVVYLSGRQIDPSLESTVFSTQQMIRDSISVHHSKSIDHPHDSKSSSLVDLSSLLAQCESLSSTAESLVARTADAIVYFERSSVGDLRTTHCRKCNEEISFLILTNSRLALEFRQAYHEIKKIINDAVRESPQKGATRGFNPSPPNLKKNFADDILKSNTEKFADFSQYENTSRFSSSKALSLDQRESYGKPSVDHDLPSPKQDMSMSYYSSTPAQLPYEPQVTVTRAREVVREKPSSGMVLHDPTPMRKADSFLSTKSSPDSFGLANSSSKDFNRSKWESHSSYDSSKTIDVDTPIRQSISKEDRVAVSTPNQKAAQASIVRLSKLGSEIDLLQSKLDEIDGKRKSKIITRTIHR